MGDCQQVAECPWTENRSRHIHPCNDLRQIDEPCNFCGHNLWIILFGSVLPTRVQCQVCGAGFNLTERLRQAANESPVSRGARW